MNAETTTAPLPPSLAGLADLPGLRVSAGAPLAAHTTMGLGGNARFLAVADDPAALPAALGILRACGLPWMVLGGGSNSIFTDAGYDGVIVKLGRGFRAMRRGPGENQVTAGAAAPLSAVMNFARRESLAGLVGAAGAPGARGGAIAANAGAGPGDTCSLVDSVDLIDAGGHPRTLARGGFDFHYRWCELRAHVILGATLGLCPDDPAAIRTRIDAALAKRHEQPIGERCSGCMFKNPPGDYAGRLIDAAGLKGLRVGGASVSPTHANFMVNEGGASAADIEALVGQVRGRVRDRFGVELELEIRFIPPDAPQGLP